MCPVVLAVVALVLASSSDKRIAASRGALTGESLNKAARIISWIHLGLAALALGGIIVLLIVAAASNTDDLRGMFGLLLGLTGAS